MQPDIWEECWRPACVLDMHTAMWSTRCRRACVRSHAERHTGGHQPESDWLLSSIDIYDLPLISPQPDHTKASLKREREPENKARVSEIFWEFWAVFKRTVSLPVFETAPRGGSVRVEISQVKIGSVQDQSRRGST